MKSVFLAITATAAVCTAQLASAVPVVFYGENLSPGALATGDPVNVRNNFLGSLNSGVGTEDFESGGLSLNFAGSSGDITATLSGTETFIESSAGSGRFATSGSNYVETGGGGDFQIDFSAPISAFGFYGTDIGDFGNTLTLTLTNGVTETVDFPLTLGSGGSTSGSLGFFGFIDPDASYSSIAFNNEPGGDDVFGFDDMTIGDIGQIEVIIPPTTVMPDPTPMDPVDPTHVPVPAGLPLLLGAIGGLGLLGRRKAARG